MTVVVANKRYVNSVEELDVFSIAYDLSIIIHKATLTFPKIEQYDLASQMRRASKSICANLAEGFAKQSDSKAEFRRFISLAIGSCGEMSIWCRYCADLEYVDKTQSQQWRQTYSRVIKMLQALKKSSQGAV
jgi:four helix bundle protein